MNIFILDRDPVVAAKYLCDQHVVKMPLETAQMLSTVVTAQVTAQVSTRGFRGFRGFHGVLGDPHLRDRLYKPTHQKHPCTIWAGASLGNFQWLVSHGMAISEEYTKRYGKTHASQKVIALCRDLAEDLEFDGFYLTPFPQAMPTEYKGEDPVAAYRAYYIGEKLAFAKWKRGSQPSWIP